MSKTLIKAARVSVLDDKRKIDSNQMVSERLAKLAEILEPAEFSDNFVDEFTEGLDPEQVEQLLGDRDAAEHDAEAIEQTLTEARIEAEQIINEANAEAQRIAAEADENARELMAQAQENGHNEGYEAGYQEGYQEGLAKTQQLEDDLNLKAEQLADDYETRIAELEPRFVETLTEIYEHVFHVDLSDKTELILYLLRDAIRDAGASKNFIVHISAEDIEYVREHKDVLAESIPASVNFEIIEDTTLPKGNCYVESDGGIFDCGIDTELELLKKELRLLSYSGSNQ